MILYEVNLNISTDILDEYLLWLKIHIQDMLKFHGFKTARLFRNQDSAPSTVQLSVHYEIESMQHLDNYLKQFSSKMRAEALERFPGKFTANRRILIQKPI